VSQGTIGSAFRNIRRGRFEESFADLSFAASDYADLPLEDIKDFLHDDAAKGQEVFEAFGMKFPAGKVTVWGFILILGVQLYFFVYLRQLSGKLRADDAGWDVPWVGMDTSALSRAMLVSTLVFLPPTAMALLGSQAFVVWRKTPLPLDGWHRWSLGSEPYAFALGLIASFFLGVFSWRYRPRVKAEEPVAASPMFF
jgi:hypothetical protein